MEKVRWKARFEIYLPFYGWLSEDVSGWVQIDWSFLKIYSIEQDEEQCVVDNLASCPSVENSRLECGPEHHDAFWIQDLVVELKLDPTLQASRGDENTVLQVFNKLVEEIHSHMCQSMSVVIRGWIPTLSLRFSKLFMALQFRSLGQMWEWLALWPETRTFQKRSHAWPAML